jgi:hypothetical protein
MRKCVAVFFLLIFFAAVIPVELARADVDPRVSAFGTIAVYGTVGGALLGTASMAFGTNGRAIAQGASIGLYLGIIFGSYIVASHSKRSGPAQPQQDGGRYDDTDPYGGGTSSPVSRYWDNPSDINNNASNNVYNLSPKYDHKLFYLNFFNKEF